MKKLLLTLVFVSIASVAYAGVISVDSFVSPDDVSCPHLEDFRTKTVNGINNADGQLIQVGTISADALSDGANPVVRWNEAFNNWVKTGLIMPTSASLSTTTTAGLGYIYGVRVEKDQTPKTYTASKWTFVDLSKTGTYTYTEQNIGVTDPAITTNSMRIARVSTDGTTVSAVRDDRVFTISLDNNQSDSWRTGLYISVTSPDTITIAPGIVYVGTARIAKITNTVLDLSVAGDWVSGSRNTNTYGFVVINPQGTMALTTDAPDSSDTDSTAIGKLRYKSIGSNWYRYLAWFYMDTRGSGNVQESGRRWSNFRDGDAPNASIITGESNVTVTSATFADIPEMDMRFYTTGGPLAIDFVMPLDTDSGGVDAWVGLSIDGVQKQFFKSATTNAGSYMTPMVIHAQETLAQGGHTIKVQWRSAAKINHNGQTDGIRSLTTVEL